MVSPTLCDPMDCSPPGSSVHGILQTRILEWVTTLSSRGSSWPRDRTWIFCIAGRLFTVWATRNWCFRTVVLEKTLESPLDCKEIKPVNPKRNQPWIFIGRTGAEAPIFWPPDVKNWHTGKDPDAGEDWGQEEKGATENEMVGWHHWVNGHEFEQTLGVNEGQGSLVCCSSWGHKESDTTEWLNWAFKKDSKTRLVNIDGRRGIWGCPVSVFSLAWVFCIFKKPHYGKYEE